MNPRYPIMAALLAASLGTVSLGTSHATPTTTCPAANPQEKDVVNILTGIICREAQPKADIGEKLAAFVLSVDGSGPMFVSKDIFSDAAKKTAVAEAAKKWTGIVTPDKVAELYYVMGDGAPPAWVTGHPVLKEAIKPATDLRRRRLTERPANPGKIPWQEFAKHTNLFLLDAAAAAHAILADARTFAEINTSIGRNEDAPVVPGGPGRRGAGDFTTFSPEYMYAGGGQLGEFKDKDGLPVPYNIKLETTKDHNGVATTNIVVYDLSQSPVYLQRFPITTRGETNFRLGSPQYNWSLVLEVRGVPGSDDAAIMLRRPADKEGKEAIRTTANALAQARLDQAVQAGQVVEIGGQSFYLSAQGGKNGSYLYYPTALAGRSGASWSQLKPEHVSVIAKIGPDGLFVPVDGTPDIGVINGKKYRNEYDAATRRWAAKEGQGAMPAAPAASVTPSATVMDRVGAAANTAGWQADDAAMAGLSPGVREKYRITTQMRNGQRVYNIFTPAEFIAGGSIELGGITDLRGVGHHIAWKRGDEVIYQDLLVKAVRVSEAGQQRETFDLVAVVKAGSLGSAAKGADGRRNTHKDHEVISDGLKTYLGFSDAQVKTTVDNIRAQAGSGEYSIEEAKSGRVIIQIPPTKTVQVFPSVSAQAAAASSQGEAAGAAVGIASSAGGADVPFQATIDVALPGAFMKLKRVKMDHADPAKATAALYVKETADEKDAQWYLYVKYRESIAAAAGAPANTVVRRTDRLLVFSNVASDNRWPLPDLATLSIKGHTGQSVALDARTIALAQVRGSGPARGIRTMHRAPGEVSKANCVGPILWWGGLSEAQAMEAGCVKGRLD